MKLSLNLENCYGIGNLKHDFDFYDDKPIIIHSSNGTMKTSLCKTFIDIQQGKSSKDQIYTNKTTVRHVLLNGKPATSHDIRVFNSYENSSIRSSFSKIILDNSLKLVYDSTMQAQLALEEDLILKLAKAIGQKPDKTKELLIFAFESNTLNEALMSAFSISKSSLKHGILSKYSYKELFDSPIKKVVSDKTVSDGIKSYTSQYQKILSKSTLFTSGVFDISNLKNVSTVLSSENYFKGGNRIQLNGNSVLISSDKELKQLIDAELSNISKDPQVKKTFENIVERCGSQKNLEIFFSNIKQDYQLSNLYKDIKKMERMYLSFHLSQYPLDVQTLKTKSKANKSTIRQLINKAKKDIPDWLNTITIFKSRFSVPYNIEIVNRENAIVGLQEPNIKFTYNQREIDEQSLITDVLSSSEKRAYYLLQVLFEIETLKKTNKDILLVFDDIADSFDYTNKYAIIEYLSEFSSFSRFYLMILTHNFDFYRAFGFKVSTRKNCYFAMKDGSNIIIQNGEYLKNLFQHYKNHIGNDLRIDITVLGFARNLIEYYIDDYSSNTLYQFYTKLLHYRPHSKKIMVNTLYGQYNSQFGLSLPNSQNNTSVYEIVIDQADLISNELVINQKIEDKILISLGMRLRVEKYLYERILMFDKSIVSSIFNMQLGELFIEYKKYYSNRNDIISLVNQVVILTPYHIHVNSFMFEPMIDVSISTLRNLYKKVKLKTGRF